VRVEREVALKPAKSPVRSWTVVAGVSAWCALAPSLGEGRPLSSSDYTKLRAVASVAFSPDGERIAYTVERNDVAGRPETHLVLLNVAAGTPVAVGQEKDTAGEPVWSPDGRWLAFRGKSGEKEGLLVVGRDGGTPRFLAPVQGTNSALTYEGHTIAWSPDSKRIAYVSATPGPETEAASGDPVVITRYKYKPDLWEGSTRFNDNRRRHVFLVDLAGGESRALTSGVHEEHSIDWSPDGAEILCVSNREPDPDLFYNPDLFAIRVADGSLRRLTATESAEFLPRWSPDGRSIVFLGTRRGLTDLETDMEDTHAWVMGADGSGRRELGAAIDNRQGAPAFAPDGRSVYVPVLERGEAHLYRLPVDGGAAERVVGDQGEVGDFSLSHAGDLVYAFGGTSDFAQLFLRAGDASARRLTDLNAAVLAGVDIAPVERMSFRSADFRFDVEAFLTLPVGRTAESKHPLIVRIHGGPHGQQGVAFNFRSQFYAARGWATLMVNYRGSTGYGQAFADAVFGDQNGQEAMDVLYGLSAALRRNPWIDRERLGVEGGSYGGQLTCWIVTQTGQFKAAIPLAPIVNKISYNYTTYYNMYEEMEWGMKPHQGDLMDRLWERSALKHVGKVRTPTMLVHGENDNDVPVGESEQFYVALKDVGVETVMVRYPREGHGLAEPKHLVDLMERSAVWYERHFAR
jgi:dipeptidyl aminopeptidase/acylaminoacyl peptidase